jgi:hypothetical protein
MMPNVSTYRLRFTQAGVPRDRTFCSARFGHQGGATSARIRKSSEEKVENLKGRGSRKKPRSVEESIFQEVWEAALSIVGWSFFPCESCRGCL